MDIITFIRCRASGIISKCLPIDGGHHGISVGESTHSGEIDGDCGGQAACVNANCVN